jgi:tRNA(Leu) C34 or U34 (ribose-2'-O)-methylase TrmL
MENITEKLYGKRVVDAVEKLTNGLNEIESENSELFTEMAFSKYYLISYPSNAMLLFTKESEELPRRIIDQATDLCKKIAEEVAAQN